MLYKHSFSILCGHLNLNKKKIEFGRLPVKPTGKPVKPAGIPVQTVCTENFKFKFDFDRFGLVSGQTAPVYWYWTPPVWRQEVSAFGFDGPPCMKGEGACELCKLRGR